MDDLIPVATFRKYYALDLSCGHTVGPCLRPSSGSVILVCRACARAVIVQDIRPVCRG